MDFDVMTEDDYHLGTSEEEFIRLGYQHQVWQDVTTRLWSLAGFGPGQHLADLGAGPGFVTLELARLVGPGGCVHAIEAASSFVSHLNRRVKAEGGKNVSVHHADVHHLPLGDGSVDGAFARWLLCFVENPQAVCDEVARVLRSGGVFVAWDYFNYNSVGVFPEHAAIRRLFDAYHRSAVVNKGNYDIGQELPGMLIRSGFEITHLEPISKIGRPGSRVWSWVTQFTTGYVPKLLEAGLMSESEARALWQAWKDAESNPAAFFFPPPMLGIIARKT